MAESTTPVDISTPKQTNILTAATNLYRKNEKPLHYLAIAILLIVIGYLAYSKLYLPKKEKEGQAALFHAQNYFAKDSFVVALNGDGENEGFTDIINNYSGTKSANLSKYYAGISYLNIGKFEDAIEMLKSYSAPDMMTKPMAFGAIGDAYMELNKTEDGLSYYRKAAQASDNELTAPMFWIKYGNACEQFNQLDNAKDAYTTVAKKYSLTSYGREAEKFLVRIETKIATK